MTFRKRILVITSTGLAAIGIGAAYLFFQLARPIGHGPAGPLIQREVFSSAWTSRKVLLLGLGDSVTAGFGARKGLSYFDRLTTNPADDFPEMQGINLGAVFPNFQSTNLAVSGSTSMEVLSSQLNFLPTNSADVFGVVVMTTGGNDLIHNYGRTPPRAEAMYGATLDEAKPWVADFGRRLDTVFNQIKNHFPGGCEIYLATIFDPTDGVGDSERAGLPVWKDSMAVLAACNAAIQHATNDFPEVHVVDAHEAFLGHGIHCTQFWRPNHDRRDPHYWFYFNLEDPNERGYDVIRRLFLNEMAKNRNRIK